MISWVCDFDVVIPVKLTKRWPAMDVRRTRDLLTSELPNVTKVQLRSPRPSSDGVLDLLEVWNTGHNGRITTLHADSGRSGLS